MRNTFNVMAGRFLSILKCYVNLNTDRHMYVVYCIHMYIDFTSKYCLPQIWMNVLKI